MKFLYVLILLFSLSCSTPSFTCKVIAPGYKVKILVSCDGEKEYCDLILEEARKNCNK